VDVSRLCAGAPGIIPLAIDKSLKETFIEDGIEVRMKNFLPRDVYDVDETGYWARTRIVTGVFFGVCMSVAMYFILSNTPNLLHPPTPGRLLLMGILSGLFFGVALTEFLRLRARQLVDRLYAADLRLVVPPPAEDIFSYQLPCTRIAGHVGVGGILYLGNLEFMFSPHKLNPPSATALRIGPVDAIEVRLAEALPQRNWLQRILVPRPQPYLEIEWGAARACFLVPNAVNTSELLARFVREVPKTEANQKGSRDE